MHLIFDTETSGFIVPNYPYTHPNQAKIMQVAAILLDESFDEVASFNSLIDIPDYAEINEKAFEAHGLTKELCKKYGMPIEAAIINIDAFRAKSKYQIGHNIDFDISMIHHEECSIFGSPRFSVTVPICTMNLMTPICKIPSKRGGFKWPKLQEAYKHLFGVEFDNSHSALADVRATAKIYKYLIDEGLLNLEKDSITDDV